MRETDGHNATLHLSRVRTPGWEGFDAFKAHRGGEENLWKFPFFEDARRVVKEAVADCATATMILPMRQAQDCLGGAVTTAQQPEILPDGNAIPLSGNERLPAQRRTGHIAPIRLVNGGRPEAARDRARRHTLPVERRVPQRVLRSALVAGLMAGSSPRHGGAPTGLVASASPGRRADKAAAAFLRGFCVGDSTAAMCAANSAAISRYCMRRGRCAWPADTTTVVNFVGWQRRREPVKA